MKRLHTALTDGSTVMWTQVSVKCIQLEVRKWSSCLKFANAFWLKEKVHLSFWELCNRVSFLDISYTFNLHYDCWCHIGAVCDLTRVKLSCFLGDAGLHKLCQPGSLAVRKWRENEKKKRKRRENKEIERNWGEYEEMERFTLSSFSLYFFPLYPFPISKIVSFCHKMLNTALLSRIICAMRK